VLWVLGEPPDEGEVTTHPPLCLPCAEKSVQACPHLRRQYVALRVRSFAIAGVRGALYNPGYPAPVAVDAVGLGFGDPRIPWVKAGQLIMRLGGFTTVELAAG